MFEGILISYGFKTFADWAIKRIRKFLNEKRWKKLKRIPYDIESGFCTNRSFYFRGEILTDELKKHLRYPRKYKFGLLFGNIIQNTPVEYEITTFISFDYIKKLSKIKHERLPRKKAEKKKALMKMLSESCNIVDAFLKDVPVDKCNNLRKERSIRAMGSIAYILWYLFFQLDYGEAAFLYTNACTGMLTNSRSIRKIESLRQKVWKGGDSIKNKKKLTKYQRQLFFERFIGFYAMSPGVEGKTEEATKAIIPNAKIMDLVKDMEEGKYSAWRQAEDYLLKDAFVKFFHTLTVMLEKLFTLYEKEFKSKHPEYIRQRLNLMKRIGRIRTRGKMTKLGNKKYNPLLVVFMPYLQKYRDLDINKRCIGYVDYSEGDEKDFKLIKVPYKGLTIEED